MKAILKIQTSNLVAAAAAALALVSCQSSSTTVDAVASEALFDSFCYQGNDDFYNNNPLPSASSFYNPILPGWYSDPSVCTNGKGDYFLATSTFVYYPGVPLFHSRDLVNWKQIGYVLSRESQLNNMMSQHISGGIFAPALSYNPANETYYMITTNVGAGNFFVKTKDPFGEWSDPIYLPDVQGIDPSFFFDEDGKAYIVNNDEPTYPAEYSGHRSIRIQEFDVEHDCTVGPRPVLVDKGCRPEENPIWIEGPHLYKINGYYYLMDAEGGTSVNHSEVIFRSNKVTGPYIPWAKNPILTQRHLSADRENPITCAGHADLIKVSDKEWWAVFLACRPLDGGFGYENLGRETFIMPVRWTADGYPVITEGDELVKMICERPGVTINKDARLGNFTYNDNFDGDSLAMEWMTLRSAGASLYKVGERKGFLSLKCDSSRASERCTPAVILRQLHHHKFVASTTMVFNPKGSEEAGLILFKDETHHYFVTLGLADGKKAVKLHKVVGNADEVVATSEVDQNLNEISLMVRSDGASFIFGYSLDGGESWKTVGPALEARTLSTANAGGFTGTTIGLYAIK